MDFRYEKFRILFIYKLTSKFKFFTCVRVFVNPNIQNFNKQLNVDEIAEKIQFQWIC